MDRQTGRQLPEIQHQTGHHPRLGGLSLWDVVEKQFTIRDHGVSALPALLHAAGLRDLTKRRRHVSLWNCSKTTSVLRQYFITYPDIALIGGADASLDVDALRPLGLLCWDWTDQGGVVFTGDMADEGTH